MKEIQLTQGKIALIDDEMFDRVSYFRWYLNKRNNCYYAATKIWVNSKRQTLSMHRLIMNMPDIFIDHADTDGLNNTKNNLRLCTRSENAANQNKVINNTSGYKGVSWHKNKKKYIAAIMKNNKTYFLGYYDSPLKAAESYNIAAISLYGKYARINILQHEV